MTTITMTYAARVRAFNLRHLRRAANDSDCRHLLFSLRYRQTVDERACHEQIGIDRTYTLIAAGLLRRTLRQEPIGVTLLERTDGSDEWERFMLRAEDCGAAEEYARGLADQWPAQYVTLRIPGIAHASSRGWSWCEADGGYYDDVSISHYRVLRRFCVSVEARDGYTRVRVPYGYAAMIGLDWATEEARIDQMTWGAI